MKQRSDFVSNSSTSSFIINSKSLKESILDKLINVLDNYDFCEKLFIRQTDWYHIPYNQRVKFSPQFIYDYMLYLSSFTYDNEGFMPKFWELSFPVEYSLDNYRYAKGQEKELLENDTKEYEFPASNKGLAKFLKKHKMELLTHPDLEIEIEFAGDQCDPDEEIKTEFLKVWN